MILPQTTELHFPVQNSGVACSFFDEEQSGKREMVRGIFWNPSVC